MDSSDTFVSPVIRPRKTHTRVLDDRGRLQRVFSRMKRNCLNPHYVDYPSYGGRGIYICDEWLTSGTSNEFVQWALGNGYQQGLETDRINNDGPYAPWNVRFVTGKENRRNMRTNVYVDYQGERTLLVALVEQKFGESSKRELNRVVTRLHRGWSLARALNTPVVSHARKE